MMTRRSWSIHGSGGRRHDWTRGRRDAEARQAMSNGTEPRTPLRRAWPLAPLLLVATENDKVYGLNPSTGALLWGPLSLGAPWKAADIGCGDLTPNIGVTATPVIDPATNTAYLTHKTYASGTSGTARWYMDAIDL